MKLPSANSQLPKPNSVASAFRRKMLTVAIVVLLPALTSAQFGHPLKGQWSGEWGPKNSPTRLLLDFDWDGKDLTGKINPGTGAEGTVKKVTIDYSPVTSWKVQIEGEVNEGGKVIPVRVDGTLENLGAYTRAFHGTWTQGTRKGEFAVTRN